MRAGRSLKCRLHSSSTALAVAAAVAAAAAAPSAAGGAAVEAVPEQIDVLPFDVRSRYLRSFERDGFLILRSFFSRADVEECHRYLDRVIWSARPGRRPLLNGQVTFPGVYQDPAGFYLPYADRFIRNMTYRLNLRDVKNLMRETPVYKFIFHPRILGVGTSLLGGPIKNAKQGGLMFERGTQQELHLDPWYGTAGNAKGGSVAAWFAFDRVDENNGPIIYIPGSHKWRETNFTEGESERWRRLRHSTDEHGKQAQMEAKRHMPNLRRLHFGPGDVLFFAETWLHGGDTIRDPTRTRRSMITHFMDRE